MKSFHVMLVHVKLKTVIPTPSITVSAPFEPHSSLQPHPMKMLIEPQSKTNIETIEPHLELNPTHK